MHNDSIETLLLRHYGEAGPTPPALEQRLLASMQRETAIIRRTQQATTQLHSQRLNRRQAIQLVALGSAGVGLLSLSLEGLHMVGTRLMGADSAQPVLP